MGSEKIKNEIIKLKKEIDFLNLTKQKHNAKPLDELEIRGLALILISIYNGIEKILSLLLSKQHIKIENKRAWHSEILKKSEETEIISKTLKEELEKFLGLRHFIRHAYSFEIDYRTILNVMNQASEIVDLFMKEIQKENIK